jgi:hypothetical protein
MILYDKKGNSFDVPHPIDVTEWLATGEYSLDKPEEKKRTQKQSEES